MSVACVCLITKLYVQSALELCKFTHCVAAWVRERVGASPLLVTQERDEGMTVQSPPPPVTVDRGSGYTTGDGGGLGAPGRGVGLRGSCETAPLLGVTIFCCVLLSSYNGWSHQLPLATRGQQRSVTGRLLLAWLRECPSTQLIGAPCSAHVCIWGFF